MAIYEVSFQKSEVVGDEDLEIDSMFQYWSSDLKNTIRTKLRLGEVSGNPYQVEDRFFVLGGEVTIKTYKKKRNSHTSSSGMCFSLLSFFFLDFSSTIFFPART